jgi:phospholipase C
MIMGCYTPATLPILSGLARGYAVCDHWFSSAPTMTMPNRAFACTGTSGSVALIDQGCVAARRGSRLAGYRQCASSAKATRTRSWTGRSTVIS